LFNSALSSSFIVLNSAPVVSKPSCSQTWIPVTTCLDQLIKKILPITLIYQIIISAPFARQIIQRFGKLDAAG